MQTSSHCYCCKWHRKECRKNAFIYVGIYVCVSYLPASFAQLICYHQKRPLHFNLFSSFLSIFIFHFYVFICRTHCNNKHACAQPTYTHTQIFSIHSCMHFAAFFAPLSAAAISRSPLLPIVQAITQRSIATDIKSVMPVNPCCLQQFR